MNLQSAIVLLWCFIEVLVFSMYFQLFACLWRMGCAIFDCDFDDSEFMTHGKKLGQLIVYLIVLELARRAVEYTYLSS